MGAGVLAGINTCHIPTRKAHTCVFTIGRKWFTMSTTEAERFQMHEALIHAHGKEVAAIIMEHLPPTGWGDVARRSDVAGLQVLTKKDIDMLRISMGGEMQALRLEMRGEMQELRAEMRLEMEALRADLRTEMHMLFSQQLKWLVGVVITAQALATGALLAGMKLL